MQAIVAVDQNWGIGKDGRLLYRIKTDLKRFQQLTTGHTVIMGRKTLLSLPGQKGLPNRRNLVLTTNPDFAVENAQAIHTPMEAVFSTGAEDFVIGGESVYRALLPACDRVFVTKILASKEADAFFPDLDASSEWHIQQRSEIMEEDGIRFQYVDYVKDLEGDRYEFITEID